MRLYKHLVGGGDRKEAALNLRRAWLDMRNAAGRYGKYLEAAKDAGLSKADIDEIVQ